MVTVRNSTKRAPIPVARLSTVVSSSTLVRFLASAGTGKKRISTADLCSEWRNPPSPILSRMPAVSPGAKSSAREPTAMLSGRKSSAETTPSERRMRGVHHIWKTRAKALRMAKNCPKNAVLASLSAKVRSTMSLNCTSITAATTAASAAMLPSRRSRSERAIEANAPSLLSFSRCGALSLRRTQKSSGRQAANRATQISSRFSVPTRATIQLVNAPPRIAPAIPPEPISPKSRRASRELKTTLASSHSSEVDSSP